MQYNNGLRSPHAFMTSRRCCKKPQRGAGWKLHCVQRIEVTKVTHSWLLDRRRRQQMLSDFLFRLPTCSTGYWKIGETPQQTQIERLTRVKSLMAEAPHETLGFIVWRSILLATIFWEVATIRTYKCTIRAYKCTTEINRQNENLTDETYQKEQALKHRSK